MDKNEKRLLSDQLCAAFELPSGSTLTVAELEAAALGHTRPATPGAASVGYRHSGGPTRREFSAAERKQILLAWFDRVLRSAGLAPAKRPSYLVGGAVAHYRTRLEVRLRESPRRVQLQKVISAVESAVPSGLGYDVMNYADTFRGTALKPEHEALIVSLEPTAVLEICQNESR